MRTIARIAGAVALVVATTVGPAAAVNLNGVWEGTFKGVANTPGHKAKGSLDWEVRITHIGTEVRMELGGVGGDRFAGVVVDGAKPSQGTLALLSCNASHGPLDFSVIHGTAKVTESKQLLTLEVVEGFSADLVTSCTAKLTRTAPIALPLVEACE